MVFIREIYFSPLVQKCLLIFVRPERSAVHTSHRRLGHSTGGAVPLMWYVTAAVVAAGVMPRCIVIRVTGSVRCTESTKYFYHSTLCSGGICYGPVSVSLFITSRSPAHNSRLQSHVRIYALLGGVVWTFYRVLCKNGWTDRRQSLKPTPIHAKCGDWSNRCFVIFAIFKMANVYHRQMSSKSVQWLRRYAI